MVVNADGITATPTDSDQSSTTVIILLASVVKAISDCSMMSRPVRLCVSQLQEDFVIRMCVCVRVCACVRASVCDNIAAPSGGPLQIPKWPTVEELTLLYRLHTR